MGKVTVTGYDADHQDRQTFASIAGGGAGGGRGVMVYWRPEVAAWR